MKRFGSIAAALVLACVAVAMCAGTLLAQSEARVYAACERGKGQIKASALPDVVDQDRCPVAGRVIVDNGVSAVVPRPGESVFASASSPEGGQHLIVSNPRGDEIFVEEVGDEETEGEQAKGKKVTGRYARSSNGCGDRYYRHWDQKLYNYNRWYINGGSIPSGMSKSRTIAAIKRAGGAIQNVRDACGVGDGVRGELRYRGGTSRPVDINSNATCNSNDRKSVVGFGDLPRSYTGYACIYSWIKKGPNRVSSADIRLNKMDFNWTARVTGSCRNRYDVQSTVTHERGHHFGLGEASPTYHPYLTMNSATGGPCRTFKRSLGMGDAMGLNRKYR